MKNIFILSILISAFIFSACNKQDAEDDFTPADQEATLAFQNNKAAVYDNANTGKANFTIDNEDQIINEGEPLLLTNNSEHAVSYLWDFGNGDTSSEATPDYKYEIHGNYSVSLTITDANNNSHKISNELVVLCLFGGGDHDE